MIPGELKIDRDGLFYLDDKNKKDYQALLIDKRGYREDAYYHSGFYKVFDNLDYILKCSYTGLSRHEIKDIKNMLIELRNKQNNINKVDFPIGYYVKNKKLCGLLIKYYPNGISLDNLFNQNDLELIGKYFYHDEDSVHNIFLMLIDILDSLYEMFENNVYYTDTNPGNIVLYNNEVKIIDFDYRYIKFEGKDKMLRNILHNYFILINLLLTKVHLPSYIEYEGFDFSESKKIVKKLENEIRRG